MTTETMKYINNLMDSLSIPYAFMEWKSKPPGPPIYFSFGI